MSSPVITYIREYGNVTGFCKATLSFVPCSFADYFPATSDPISHYLQTSDFTMTHKVEATLHRRMMGTEDQKLQDEFCWFQDDRDPTHGFLFHKDCIIEALKTGPQRSMDVMNISGLRMMSSFSLSADDAINPCLILLRPDGKDHVAAEAGRYTRTQ